MAYNFASKEIAQAYSKYRPTYPTVLYDKVLQFLDEGSDRKFRQVAVDVGCGSGQNTRALAERFNKVIGVDGSEAQMEEARKTCSELANITLRVGSAEDLGEFLDEDSVDLVTGAVAVHFFKVQQFLEACQKVLRRGGVLAAWGYSFPVLDNPEAQEVAQELLGGTLLDYFPDPVKTHLISSQYRDLFSLLVTAFPKTERWSVNDRQKLSLREFSGLVRSYAGYHQYRKQNPDLDDPLEEVMAKLTGIFGAKTEDEKLVDISLEIFAILGKKV